MQFLFYSVFKLMFILTMTDFFVKIIVLRFCLSGFFSPIDDITFEFLAMRCRIGRGMKQKKISQE